jgi:hypothetical protein
MTKRELERALRLAARIAGDNEFFLIGSQAAYGSCRRPPTEVRLSQECDLYPKNRPETANLINNAVGRRSRFARANGFYIDVVTPELATLPTGWQQRLKPLRFGKVTAYCLEVHDLIISKLAAGRLKDLEFAGAMLHLGVAEANTVRRRVRQCGSPNERVRLRARLKAVLDDLGD